MLVPAEIAVSPTDMGSGVGLNACFGVVATGTIPLSYQWQFNSSNIAGAWRYHRVHPTP